MKHGACCRSISATLQAAGETPREFARHLRRFERAFAPQTWQERRLVRAVAEAVWRRLRACRGLARWQEEQVGRVLARLEARYVAESCPADPPGGQSSYPESVALSPGAQLSRTLQRVYELRDELEAIFDTSLQLEARLEPLRRRLVRLLEALERERRRHELPAESLGPRFRTDARFLAWGSERAGNPWGGRPERSEAPGLALSREPRPARLPSWMAPPPPRRTPGPVLPQVAVRLEAWFGPCDPAERQLIAQMAGTLALRLAVLTLQSRREAAAVARLLAQAARRRAPDSDQVASLREDLRDRLEDLEALREAAVELSMHLTDLCEAFLDHRTAAPQPFSPPPLALPAEFIHQLRATPARSCKT